MEVTETQSCPGYANGPPWLFKGSALYQLHLVKAETARSFIPKEFRLVEAFGYTLGGFFFARYSDSPAGMFDELVVIAGIVWNPPTSCAWAARVLVNSDEACIHGRKDIGLPSHVARFSKRLMTTSEKPKSKCSGFLNMLGIGTACSQNDHMDIEVTEIMGPAATALCNINLPSAAPESKSHRKWLGPAIKMSLPSFSGHTEYNPHLLKYSCQIECRVRAVGLAKISRPTTSALQCSQDKSSDDSDELRKVAAENDALRRSISVLLSRPILALEFSSLKMQVEAPTIITPRSKNVAAHS